MQVTSKFKDIKLTNVPHGNLREQFFNHYHMVKEGQYKKQLSAWHEKKVIETPYLIWCYWPEAFATHLVQQTITGVESYLSGAVYDVLGFSGRLNENLEFLRDPFSIPGERGTAAKLYKLLPALYSNEITLPKRNQKLWEDVRLFYREIRNPIFHGMQFEDGSDVYLLHSFELIADIYEWIDGWHNPDLVIPGSSWYTKLRR